MSDELRRQLDYVFWALEPYVVWLRDAGEDQAKQVHLLAHVLAGLDRLLASLTGGTGTVECWPQRDGAACGRWFEELRQRGRVLGSALDPAHRVALDGTCDVVVEVPVGAAVFAAATHALLHIGHLDPALRASGAPRPRINYADFLAGIRPCAVAAT